MTQKTSQTRQDSGLPKPATQTTEAISSGCIFSRFEADCCLGLCAGEEEADLELMDLIQKGEVAWLNASDAPKERDISSARKGGRPPASNWRQDDYDDEPSTSRGDPGCFHLTLLDLPSDMLTAGVQM